MIMNDMKQEKIFEVTFTNDSTVFIKAMDEEHAKRIVERNGTEWLSAELTVEMIIKKIEKVEDQDSECLTPYAILIT